MKEAMLWHPENGKIRCDLCGRRCLIPEGKRGFCLVRINKNNKLYTLTYGRLCSVNIDPIEKKPLFHFLPSSLALSIATLGCNFRCQFCCNWQISQAVDGEKEEIEGEDYTPGEIIEIAKRNDCKSISYTYTEPTIFFEFAFDTAKLAHKNGLKNTFVTNGYMTPEAVSKISKYLDAATVDFKGSGNPKFYKTFSLVPSVDPIFDCLKEMKKRKIHIEITNLIVPRIGDNLEDFKKLVKWIVEELGVDIPLHILRFFPNHKLLKLDATPIEILEKAWSIGKKAGLNFVYLGNVVSDKESTYCPNCNFKVIERVGYSIVNNLDEDKCPKCGFKIPVVLK